MTYDPDKLTWVRKCRELEEKADHQSGADRQRTLLQAALYAVIVARSTPHDLPRWRVRHWIGAVELAWAAGLPWVAAILAKEHLATVELTARVMKDRIAEVLAAANDPTRHPVPSRRSDPARSSQLTLDNAEVWRLLWQYKVYAPSGSPSHKAAA